MERLESGQLVRLYFFYCDKPRSTAANKLSRQWEYTPWSGLCHAERRAVREIREFREFRESSLTSLISLISLTSLSHPLTPINTINTTPTPCYCVTMLINSEECGEAPEARQPNLLSWWYRWGAITRKQRLSTPSFIFFLWGVVATT